MPVMPSLKPPAPTSGLLLRPVLDLSMLLLLWGEFDGSGMPREGVVTVPRAKLTVLTDFSSFRALLSILAPASLLENRGGSVGRGRGLLLKNKGDGGWTKVA